MNTVQNTKPQAFSLGGESGWLYVSDGVFQPNLTTKLLAESADIRPGDTVLELGCGVGPLAIYAAKRGAARVYAVDIMAEACEFARRNAELNGVADRVEVRHGNLFEPVRELQFDVIIDDVSGMSEDVSRISPWYPASIPSGGYDGTEPTIAMLTQASDYLKEKGRLYFPVISLSDRRKTIGIARDIFGDSVEALAEKMIPFCEEFKRAMPQLEALKARGVIDYVNKRSRYLWSLQIYRALKS